MARYKGWVGGRGRGRWRGGWEAGGGLNPLLGLFGLVWVSEVPAIGPNMLEWRKRHLPITGVNFRPMLSM